MQSEFESVRLTDKWAVLVWRVRELLQEVKATPAQYDAIMEVVLDVAGTEPEPAAAWTDCLRCGSHVLAADLLPCLRGYVAFPLLRNLRIGHLLPCLRGYVACAHYDVPGV
jgi:hypothetical protein